MQPRNASLLDHYKDYNGLVRPPVYPRLMTHAACSHHVQTWNTLPFNNTGHPALTIPCGMLSPPEGPDNLRLPIGMQLVGRFWEELMLYKAALAWSDAYNWKEL